jgi:hypothetical protein
MSQRRHVPARERQRRKSCVAQASKPPAYAVLDDALASGEVEITEVSDQGSVPELRVVNRGATPTLIVDGEELVGAKQNKLARSVAVDALDSSSAPAELTSRTPEFFLAAVADSPSHTAPALGACPSNRL